ncbi:MAG TPA: hypothetical protein VI007_05645 [bacterium]
MVRRLIVALSLAAVATLPVRAGIPGAGGMRVLFEADSVYHHIVVTEDNEARYLRFDRSFQSGMMLADPFESPFLYADYAHLGLIFAPKTTGVLVVGLARTGDCSSGGRSRSTTSSSSTRTLQSPSRFT